MNSIEDSVQIASPLFENYVEVWVDFRIENDKNYVRSEKKPMQVLRIYFDFYSGFGYFWSRNGLCRVYEIKRRNSSWRNGNLASFGQGFEISNLKT